VSHFSTVVYSACFPSLQVPRNPFPFVPLTSIHLPCQYLYDTVSIYWYYSINSHQKDALHVHGHFISAQPSCDVFKPERPGSSAVERCFPNEVTPGAPNHINEMDKFSNETTTSKLSFARQGLREFVSAIPEGTCRNYYGRLHGKGKDTGRGIGVPLYATVCVTPRTPITIMGDNGSPQIDLERGPASEFGVFVQIFLKC